MCENHKPRHRDQDALEERTDKLDRPVAVRVFLIRRPLGIDKREKRADRRHDVHDALKRIAENRIGARCEPTRELQTKANDSDHDRPTRRRASAS